MQLCVSIATTQLGPDKDLGKLSLLWLQRAQASHQGAVAHFMQKLLQSNEPAPAIGQCKALQTSLNENVWKYVYEARDLLRKDIIVANVRLERSAKANDLLTDRNSTLQARIQQLEETVTGFEREARAQNKEYERLIAVARAKNTAYASLESKLQRAIKDKDVISKFLSICSVCESHVQAHTGTLYCENCVTTYCSACEAEVLGPDGTLYCKNCVGRITQVQSPNGSLYCNNNEYEAEELEDLRQSYLDEAHRDAEYEVNDILTEEAESEARAIDAAIEKDQKEELQRVEKLNQLSAEQLEHIQELVARETVSFGIEKKKKKKKINKKSKKTSSKEGGSSSSEI